MGKWRRSRMILMALIAVILLINLVPYAIPVSRAANQPLSPPFDNSQLIEIEGISLHTRVWESESAPEKGRILMIHGLGGSTYSWEEIAPGLAAEGWRVVAVDLPGFGYSTRQTGLDHSQSARARLLWQLLDRLEPDQPWVLCGHSMGGGAVSAMALSSPDRTERLILVDAALDNGSPTAVSWLADYPPFARLLAVVLDHVVLSAGQIPAYLETAYREPPTAGQISAYTAPLQISGTARVLVDLVKTADGINSAGLAALENPIDAIWGEQDTVIPVDTAYELQQQIPGMRLEVIPEAGHVPSETHPEAVLAILIGYLQAQ